MKKPSLMRNIGLGLLLATYTLLLYTALAAPAYAHAHPHLDKALLAQDASPWPVALPCSLAIVGIVLTLVPIRPGERCALWTSLADLVVLLFALVPSDPLFLWLLDSHQPGY